MAGLGGMSHVTTSVGDIAWGKARDHERELLSDLNTAHVRGKIKKADYLTSRYLQSYDSRLVAMNRAFIALPIHRRPQKRKLPEIADCLNAWRGTDEKVVFRYEPKKGNPEDFRMVMDFGIENRALQYLVRETMKVRLNRHPNQLLTQGGRDVAIETIQEGLLNGYQWAIEIDISDCYPSINTEHLSNLLPLPKEVTSRVLTSSNLYLSPTTHTITDISHIFGCDDLEIDDPDLFAQILFEDIAVARRGIPQGSATSDLVLEHLLASVLTGLPNCGLVYTYADNFLIMAKQENEVVSILEALLCALKAHPVGPLVPNVPKRYEPGEVVQFLGYALTVEKSICLVAPSQKNMSAFKTKFWNGINSLEADGLPLCKKRHRLKKLRRDVASVDEWIRVMEWGTALP